MTNSFSSPRIRPASNPEQSDPAAEQHRRISHYDMDLALPANSPGNLARKSQQVKARAAAVRHIDKALAKVPVSDEAKASRKSRLVDMPEGTARFFHAAGNSPVIRRMAGAAGSRTNTCLCDGFPC